MKDKKIFYDIDYCMYSDWGYKKTTRVWTNRTDFIPLRCDGKGNCGNMINLDNHKCKHKTDINQFGGGSNRDMRYRIPQDLIFSLLFD